MDHAYIDEHNIVARYEMGTLASAERIGFEEHFVDCPHCQEQLTLAQDFRQGLRAAHHEGLLESTSASSPPSSLAWRWALRGMAASLVLLSIPALLLVREIRNLNRELNRANQTTETLRHQNQAEQETSTELQKQIAELGKAGQNNTEGASDTASKRPALASVFPLSITRSGDSSSEPVNLVIVTRPPHVLVFSLELEQPFESYRIALGQVGGPILWKADHVKPLTSGTLSITVPSSFFRQGDYVLTLEGRTSNGTYAPAGHYSFRVKALPKLP
jgi:hypothetical protein